MHPHTTCIVLLLTLLGSSLASPLLEIRAGGGISQSTYDDLVWYTKYSSAVYQWSCPSPLGNVLIKEFDKSGTQGFVVRDDQKKELVVAFRGTLEVIDALVDFQIILTPLVSTGIRGVGNALVHTGFLGAYNIVAEDVLSVVTSQLGIYPGYNIVVTGHSLGGSVASIAALSIRAHFPSVPLKLFTFGQPRTGNAAFASYVENTIGTDNIFRAVHTFDGIPTILFKVLGYRHFATEYWQFKEPAQPSNVRKCTGGDDPACSDSILSTGLNPAHVLYFGQVMAINPLLCI